MKHLLSSLGITLLSVLLSLPATATPVGPMSFQGRLLDDQGIPVTGTYNFKVRIYDDPSVGTLQYSEDQDSISVDDGVYSFRVGTGTNPAGAHAWDINLWQGNLNDLYMEIQVGAETLTPRHELTSAPHAFTSTFALSADSLGNKTAAEFDNILEGVCTASKGKWLDVIERCLGVKATVTNEDAATMASDLNYSNLNLTQADITNTQFNNVDFSGTLFDNTTLTISGFNGADLSGARLDNVNSTDNMPNMPINLTDATITNMNLSGWNLSGAIMDGLSAANLSACPSALPTNWVCSEMISGSGRYFLMGPGANLSANSEAAISKHGLRLLDVDPAKIQSLILDGASFEGVDISDLEIRYASITNGNFDYITLEAGIFAQLTLDGSTFRYSNIRNMDLEHATFSNNDFTLAKLEDAQFSSSTGMTFDRAKMTRVRFDELTNPSFKDAYFDNSTFGQDITGTLDLTGARLYNSTGFAQGQFGPLSASTQLLNNLEVRSFGDPGSFTFTFPDSASVDGLYMELINLSNTNFNGGTFTNCEIHNSTNDYVDTPNVNGATFDNCIFNQVEFGCEGANYQINIINSTIYGYGNAVLDSKGFSSGFGDSCWLEPGLATTDPGFLNVTFDNIQFIGNWSYLVDQTCPGCSFVNGTNWAQSAVCPDGSSPFEEPIASGVYQCPGWY